MKEIDLNERTQNALDLMLEGRNLFITGKAGTGKSTLLSYFCATAEKRPVVLAPTGVAALNVRGQTIHRFFHFYIDVTPQKIRSKQIKPHNAKLYKKLHTIIIDEISMVRADLLDCIDAFLRLYGPRPGRPFGGVQMIFIGDLYQLPPVVGAEEKEIFASLYETPYFFSAQAMTDFVYDAIELDKVYRQKDGAFVSLLNRVRAGTTTERDLKKLNKRVGASTEDKGDFYLTLTTTNKRADEINDAHLSELKGRLLHSQAKVGGEFGKEYFPTATDLTFKIGAQIMMLNNDSERQWVNGSIGRIEAIGKDEDGHSYLSVRLQEDDRDVRVKPNTWEVYRFGVEDNEIVSEAVGTFTQYPFRLAWAVTIHKSQGKTFNRVAIDMGRGAFVAGQTYVALSRCTSLDGLSLSTPIYQKSITTDARVRAYLTKLGLIEQAPENPLTSLIEQAIRDEAELEILYLKGDETQTRRTVRPTRLGDEVYKGTSFIGMRAHCSVRGGEQLFSLERILEAKISVK